MDKQRIENAFLVWLGWILTTLAITAASLAILAAINYAMHTPEQRIGTANTLEHNPNMQLETK